MSELYLYTWLHGSDLIYKDSFSREEKVGRFFEGEVRPVQSSFNTIISSALQLQKNDASQLQKIFNALGFHGAAKASLYFIPLISMTDELSTTHISVKLQARPRLACGRCGGARRGTRRARTRGMAATLLPPQKNKAAIDRASTSCEVSLE